MMYGLDHKLNLIYDQIVSHFEGITAVAQAIAAIGALLYISYRVFGALARAQEIDFFPLMRPFVIGLCILFFRPVILEPINYLSDSFNKGVESLVPAMQERVEIEKKNRDVKQKEREERTKDTVLETEVKDADGNVIEGERYLTMDEEGSNWLTRGILSVIEWLAEVIMWVAMIFIRILRMIYLIVLSIIGPITFAFAIFDGFTSGISSWFSRYISTALWTSIMAIVQGIMYGVQASFYATEAEVYEGTSVAGGGDNALLSVVFHIVAALAIFAIPSISGWIIPNGGNTGGLGRALNVISSGAASFAGAGLGAAAGGSLGAAGNKLAGTASNMGGAGGKALGTIAKGLQNVGGFIEHKSKN